MERRIVAQMLTCMDDLAGPPPSAQAPSEGSEAPLPEPAAPASRHVVIIGKCHSTGILNYFKLALAVCPQL